MEKPNHGLDALYEYARGPYIQRTFATTKRDFKKNEILTAEKPKYSNDLLFLQHLLGGDRET